MKPNYLVDPSPITSPIIFGPILVGVLPQYVKITLGAERFTPSHRCQVSSLKLMECDEEKEDILCVEQLQEVESQDVGSKFSILDRRGLD